VGDFIDLMNSAMKEKGLSVRALENEIKKRFGKEAKASKSLIHFYQKRSNIPSYTAGYQIAEALDLDTINAMNALLEYRKKCLSEQEEEEFKKFMGSK